MIRKPRNQRYKIKAFYIENGVEHTFYCKENKIKNITNEMGASMPIANGERLLETDSPLDFKIEQLVRVGSETLSVANVSQTVDDKDNNAMRGNPSYITTILIK